MHHATKHGLNYHPLRIVWQNLKSRCYFKRNKLYYRYGAKGVKMCTEWKYDLKAFHDWAISNGWEKGKRIVLTGDIYEPGKCKII